MCRGPIPKAVFFIFWKIFFLHLLCKLEKKNFHFFSTIPSKPNFLDESEIRFSKFSFFGEIWAKNDPIMQIRQKMKKLMFDRFCCNVLKSGAVPQHVAFIMDGNRRFARAMGWQSVLDGHMAGFDKLAEVRLLCCDARLSHDLFLLCRGFFASHHLFWSSVRSDWLSLIADCLIFILLTPNMWLFLCFWKD